MYISVESYEAMYLNNKDVSVLEREVEKLRVEIARLKTKLESPAHRYSGFSDDNGVVEIYRSYFDKAAEYLSEKLGGISVLTEEEKVARIIDSMTDDIECVTLTVGMYLENKYELNFSADHAEITEIHLGEAPITREGNKVILLEALRALHLGEWKANYLPEHYGCTLSEPTKWQVRIDYSGSAAPRFYDGLGIFPYNFSALCKMLGAEVY